MQYRLVLLLVFVSCVLSAQGRFQIAEIRNFKTESGQIIASCKLGYRTFGRLNADKTNAVLFPTWFGGHSNQLAGQAGEGVDTTRFFMIAVDALGNGVSSSPSNTKNFPAISIRDMVNAEYRLVTEILGIKRLYAVMGISMGGMQTFEWLAAYPDMMEKAVPIIGTPQQSFYDNLLWQTECAVIEQAGRKLKKRKAAMRQVLAIHYMHRFTPQNINGQHKPEALNAFVEKQYQENDRHPDNWICQAKAMMGHDIYRSTNTPIEAMKERVKAKTLVIVAAQDQMVNPAAAVEFARSIQADLLELKGDCGHSAPGCEGAQVLEAVRAFLR